MEGAKEMTVISKKICKTTDSSPGFLLWFVPMLINGVEDVAVDSATVGDGFRVPMLNIHTKKNTKREYNNLLFSKSLIALSHFSFRV
jgi:hypothetical protein